MTAEKMNIREDFENSFWYFVAAVRVLSHEPSEQCEEMGAYNAGWEIKHDVKDFGQQVLNLSAPYLTTEQRENIAALLAELNKLPEEALAPVVLSPTSKAGCIVTMSHPAWAPLRHRALHLIELLGPAIHQNVAYLNTYRDSR